MSATNESAFSVEVVPAKHPQDDRSPLMQQKQKRQFLDVMPAMTCIQVKILPRDPGSNWQTDPGHPYAMLIHHGDQ
jgi:hypothetical protein